MNIEFKGADIVKMFELATVQDCKYSIRELEKLGFSKPAYTGTSIEPKSLRNRLDVKLKAKRKNFTWFWEQFIYDQFGDEYAGFMNQISGRQKISNTVKR